VEMKTGMALSLFLMRAISPVKREDTPNRAAMIVIAARIGSLKKLGFSKGPFTVTMDLPKMNSTTKSRIPKIEYLPNLLFGMKRFFVFILLISVMLLLDLTQVSEGDCAQGVCTVKSRPWSKAYSLMSWIIDPVGRQILTAGWLVCSRIPASHVTNSS
jgi:hypothetical protein